MSVVTSPVVDIDAKSPPFDRLRNIQPLAADRRGRSSGEHARHQLYVARDLQTRANVLIKVTSKPGLVYEKNLENEIASLTTINRELPESRYFPVLGDHGRLRDSRMYLTMTLFDEWPLATTIGPERIPARHVTHIRTGIEVATALTHLHGLRIWHVDLNPMNVLFRWESGRPVIRIVDFESSYEVARHSTGVFYNPPTTTAFSAPEVAHRAPDPRSDVFSMGAVLYTMHAGYDWTWTADIRRSVETDPDMSDELRKVLLTAVNADPDGRFRTVGEFRRALGEYLERIWPGRPW